MRKSIVVLIVAVLAAAAGAVMLSLSAPVLDEDVEYQLTSLYYRGEEILSQVDEDEVLDLLEGATRGLISRGGLPAHAFQDLVEVNLSGGEETLHVVLSAEDGLFAVYQDADWSYSIREGEALAAAVQALLPAKRDGREGPRQLLRRGPFCGFRPWLAASGPSAAAHTAGWGSPRPALEGPRRTGTSGCPAAPEETGTGSTPGE